jgi:hypothetical protein
MSHMINNKLTNSGHRRASGRDLTLLEEASNMASVSEATPPGDRKGRVELSYGK